MSVLLTFLCTVALIGPIVCNEESGDGGSDSYLETTGDAFSTPSHRECNSSQWTEWAGTCSGCYTFERQRTCRLKDGNIIKDVDACEDDCPVLEGVRGVLADSTVRAIFGNESIANIKTTTWGRVLMCNSRCSSRLIDDSMYAPHICISCGTRDSCKNMPARNLRVLMYVSRNLDFSEGCACVVKIGSLRRKGSCHDSQSRLQVPYTIV